MPAIWDLYLDPHDAALVLEACAELEERRAVREPLPIEDVDRLLERLRTVATICAEEAEHWDREAADRLDDASVDGGRWGSPDAARRFHRSAAAVADSSRRIAAVAAAAAADLASRSAGHDVPFATLVAQRTDVEARRLLGLDGG